MTQPITIAISKGRILEDSLPLLERIAIRPVDDPGAPRRLILATNRPDITLVIVRAADVPTYVEKGGADLGIAGRDVLLENPSEHVYEPVDLKIAQCRLVLAGPKDRSVTNGRLKIATKYVTTTRKYFARQGRQVEIIKLYGAMELAPLLGLADQIVDLVDTGNTLAANDLVPLATIAAISSRLIVNKAAMKMKHDAIAPLLKALEEVID